MKITKNVLGTPLRVCGQNPTTGFFRNGSCDTCPEDAGLHVVCIQATVEFLEFSKSSGNDLSTPIPEYDFPGLKAGDRWCLCAARWQEAYEAGMAPMVFLSATNKAALEVVSLAALKEYSIDQPK